MRRIRKFRAIPEVPARFMQDVNLGAGIEIERGALVILAINNDYIARAVLFLNGLRKIVRRQNG